MVERLRSLLGLTHPIIQAPMVGVSTPELAAAVSNAGGLGSLGLGACSATQARETILRTRQLTERPFNVNLFCHRPPQADPTKEKVWLKRLRPFFDEFSAPTPTRLQAPYHSFLELPDMLDMLLEVSPAVVSFHFGLPYPEQIKALKGAGMRLMGCATSTEEALQVEQAGLDIIIAQGIEAGGHRGVFEPNGPDARIDTLSLVRQIREQTALPIIATGGLMDGRDVSAALRAGADAAQLGTAFILCPESAANEAYRAALKSERARNPELTSAISGRPARGLRNRFYDLDTDQMPDYPIAYDAAKQLHAAASVRKCQDFAAHWAGQAAARCREMPAAQLVRCLADEMVESIVE